MCRLFFIFVTLIIFFHFDNICLGSWGESLFEIRRYNFGQVAIGTNAEYKFVMTNHFKQDIRVIGLNTSCNCAISNLSSELIASGKTEFLIVKLNTNGQHYYEKKAVITIHFEVIVEGNVLQDSAQLSISGYIRPDITLSAGAIEFGSVRHGESVVRQIQLEHAGKSGWKLIKVEKSNPHIHVRAEPIQFPDGSFWRNGEIRYQITATLKPDAPAGYVKDIIKFITNENNEIEKNTSQEEYMSDNKTEITIPINGVVIDTVQVKPSLLIVGLDDNNNGISKNIVVRSNRQFRILNVKCDDKRLKFTFSENESNIQIIAAFFHTKNNNADKQNLNNNKILIHTNLEEQKIITIETIQIKN